MDRLSRSALATKPLEEITSVDIAEYRDARLQTIRAGTDKPLSNSTVRLELALLSNLFEIARIEWGWCNSNPVQKIRKPKAPAGRERRLSPREDRMIQRYLDRHPNPELKAIVNLALETAMRQGEILSLQWEDINLKTGVAHLPMTKNGSKRDIPLSPKARTTLIGIGVRSQGRVFKYTSSGIKSSWRFMVQKIGIADLHFHDLRHEAVSRLFELGTLDMMEVAAISGHKSLSMLKRYTHLKAQRLVKKLENPRKKSVQGLSGLLIPYPASLVQTEDQNHHITFPDFEGEIQAKSPCKDTAIELAQHRLLKHLLRCAYGTSGSLPSPFQYTLEEGQGEMLIVDPLA